MLMDYDRYTTDSHRTTDKSRSKKLPLTKVSGDKDRRPCEAVIENQQMKGIHWIQIQIKSDSGISYI